MESFITMDSDGDTLYWVECSDDAFYLCTSMFRCPMPDVSWGTLINGYGGRWLGVEDGFVWAVTKHGAVWVWHQHTWTEWMTAGDYQWGSLVWSPDHTFLMAVQEIDHSQRLVQLSKNNISVVDQQYDFYADVAHHHGQYCWVSWQAPFMPWDESSLHITHHTKGQWQTSCIKLGSSVAQPQSTPQGLVVMSDEKGFYQPYVWRNGQWLCLQAHEVDFVPPMWLVGYRHWCYVEQLWTLRSQKGQWELFDDEEKINQPLVEVYDCMPMKQGAVLIGASVYSDPMVIQVKSNGGQYDVKVLYEVMKDWPYRLECINHGGVSSWLWWPQKQAKAPLMVWVHSGPTSQVTPAFDAKKEAWLEQGYAVLAINYTGSSGFGRIFRQALLGQWGVQDVHDVNELTTRISQHPNIDEQRIYIRGSSAGGLTVLRLIQNSMLFKAAVVYYPVSQVDALSDTHRFERHYGDRLISAEDLSHVKPCLCPLLCFHGQQDSVVPLYQTEALIAELRALDCCVKLVVFDDEGHGFKAADNLHLAQKMALEWCDIGGF